MARGEREEPGRTQVTFTLDDDLLETIDELARDEDRSRSRMINVVLRRGLRAMADLEPVRRPTRKHRSA
jgi:metal-responsive CopG/Arc/MetJ family transcriptional regulator